VALENSAFGAVSVRHFSRYMLQAAEFCNIRPENRNAVWGCDPAAQMGIRSTFLPWVGRVIAIDTVPERLALAKKVGAQTLDFMEEDIHQRLQEVTKGRGPDARIYAVGTELGEHRLAT
jgi:threonine dehydrogenase-like Zn-dependent dehydrogenase